MREHDALGAMLGADTRRIDHLVQDVGAIKGDVRNVRDGVDKLQDALSVLVRFEVRMEQHTSSAAATESRLKEHDGRLQSIERKVTGWDETRTWVLRAGLLVLGAVGLAVVGLVIKGGV